ncbi:acylneuraminate cytidylyltransferase family protein [Leptospira brenneri]|uniref:Acylneuraminate cytidylyltransferase family protein n=2 Tax=Leptospira brenneri TaxID=2023182 RepID=A0A2M9Y265_9LEPT|nr:hypothetical protein CH361_10815 [Leptospira brenneri]TGK92181.1 acylneuraminate cytidylyltransferase family protein [Leptospira brenneri]
MKGHSERVPKKNVRLMNGKPLFFYIADTLKATNLFEQLAINTDSEEINELAISEYGTWVKIIERPVDLIGDFVSMNAIIDYDISLLGIDHDYFQTHSTNPLLKKDTVLAAVDQYRQGKSEKKLDSLFSVNAIQTRLYDKHLSPLNHNPLILTRTQDLDVIYEENSNFYVFSGQSFLQNKHRIGCKPEPYVMARNSIECIDIDDIADWDLAETIMKNRKNDD